MIHPGEQMGGRPADCKACQGCLFAHGPDPSRTPRIRRTASSTDAGRARGSRAPSFSKARRATTSGPIPSRSPRDDRTRA